jgi:hypothetical protein
MRRAMSFFQKSKTGYFTNHYPGNTLPIPALVSYHSSTTGVYPNHEKTTVSATQDRK